MKEPVAPPSKVMYMGLPDFVNTVKTCEGLGSNVLIVICPRLAITGWCASQSPLSGS